MSAVANFEMPQRIRGLPFGLQDGGIIPGSPWSLYAPITINTIHDIAHFLLFVI